jgi:hypothetical protein
MYKRNENYSTLTPEIILDKLDSVPEFSIYSVLREKALLFATMLYNRWWDVRKEDGNVFQRISSELLITLLSRDDYKLVINTLVDLDIIEIDNSYSVGKCPKGYRFKDYILQSKPIARKLFRTSSITRINKIELFFNNQLINKNSHLINLYNNLKLIHIDEYEANDWIIFKSELPTEKHEYYLQRVNRINAGISGYIKVAYSNKRVFTHLTNLPKELRKFLYLKTDKGECFSSKVYIDGANTQPALLCIKMKNEGYELEELFWDNCLNGKIYDFIANDISNESYPFIIDRNWVKKRFMDTILYTKDNSEFTHQLSVTEGLNYEKQVFSKYFQRSFPNVWNYLMKVKKTDNNSNLNFANRNNGGSNLAIEIQKMESELWIHQLLPEIPSEIVYTTIHDSLLIFNPTKEQVQICIDKINETSKKLYKVELPLHIDGDIEILEWS